MPQPQSLRRQQQAPIEQLAETTDVAIARSSALVQQQEQMLVWGAPRRRIVVAVYLVAFQNDCKTGSVPPDNNGTAEHGADESTLPRRSGCHRLVPIRAQVVAFPVDVDRFAR